MGKSFFNHAHSSDAHKPSSPLELASRDDENDAASGSNFRLLASDAPTSFDQSFSDCNNTPSGFGSNLVLYSSDISNPTVHGAPHIFSAAGAGSGLSHAGAASGTAAVVTSAASQGLIINVTYDQAVSTLPTGFVNAVTAVVNYFETHFTDPVTVNINVGFGEAGGYSLGGALGMSLSYLTSLSYSTLTGALTADAKTAADTSAVASLPAADPTGGTYWVSTAEAKALGAYTSTTNIDGYVGFSNTAAFDYNNADGVTSGQYDFFGVVAHEFSEVMGRMLLVGGTIGTTANSYDPLDLFHFSSSGVHDFSGSTPGYFSVNNGATSLNTFNTVAGADSGDWAGASIDAFNAFGSPGVTEPISSSDLTALDAIGWDAATSGSPPPPPPPPPTPPDLTVSILSLHDTTLSLKFNNIGSGSAAASTAGIYLSTDGTITTADILIGTIAIPSLAAGGSISGSVTVPFPSSLTAGTYHLGVIADYNNQIAESNESNNASSGSLTVILGNSGSNILTGTTGADEIIGLGSSDTLVGGLGNDTLIGGSGSDHFRYNNTNEGLDTIVDFTPGNDVLDFAHTAFGFSAAGTLSSANFVANATGPTNTAQKFWYNTSNFTLYYDADGSGPGAAHAMAQLENHATLNSTNIHLI